MWIITKVLIEFIIILLLLFMFWFLGCEVCGILGLTGDSVVKNPPAKAGDVGLTPGLGRSPGGGNGNPLQYSCLENPMDRGAWRSMLCGVAKSQTQLNDWAHTHTWDLSSSARDHTHTPCIERQSLNHWTPREVPLTLFLRIESPGVT